jgi:Kip1 ubiquitination-promoting complex protein 1
LYVIQVTFLVTHFSDSRIANPDIRDVLVQSISVLVQYKEHVVAFEKCNAARESMVGALLNAFDNRFWIPVSNILLRLCKGAGFGASKCYPHGESFSAYFQVSGYIYF